MCRCSRMLCRCEGGTVVWADGMGLLRSIWGVYSRDDEGIMALLNEDSMIIQRAFRRGWCHTGSNRSTKTWASTARQWSSAASSMK